MEGSAADNGVPDAPRARCVLWHDPGAGPAAIATVGQLESRLLERGADVIRAGTAAGALAELCVLSRDGRSGAGRAGPLSLVVVEPRKRPGSGALARAVARYVPHAVIWAFETEPAPMLRPAPAGEVEGWPGGEEPPPEPRVVVTASDIHPDPIAGARPEPFARGARPSLRLAGDPGSVEAGTRTDDQNVAQGESPEDRPLAREMLTQEELAMLLEDDGPPA